MNNRAEFMAKIFEYVEKNGLPLSNSHAVSAPDPFSWKGGPEHDELISQLKETLNKVSPETVANAFLYSLSTRDMRYRSALGSYYYAAAIPEHSHTGHDTCQLCGWMQHSLPSGLGEEYHSFIEERNAYGGIRHTCPEYALYDLQQFLLLPEVKPTERDMEIFSSILHTIDELPSTKKVGAFRELITKKKLFKSNKAQVETLLNILGICGVLSSAEHPCYCVYFADQYERAPREHSNDYQYPVNHWHVSDGVNEDRFMAVFGIEYK